MDYSGQKKQGYSRPVHILYMHSFGPNDEARTSDLRVVEKVKLQAQVEHRKQNCSIEALLLDDRCK